MTSRDVYERLGKAMREAGYEQADQVFSSERIPQGIKDGGFVIIPGDIQQRASGRGTREVTVGYEIRVAYQPHVDDVEGTLRDRIVPDIDTIGGILTGIEEFEGPIVGAVEPDTEEQYLILALGAAFSYCVGGAT